MGWERRREGKNRKILKKTPKEPLKTAPKISKKWNYFLVPRFRGDPGLSQIWGPPRDPPPEAPGGEIWDFWGVFFGGWIWTVPPSDRTSPAWGLALEFSPPFFWIPPRLGNGGDFGGTPPAFGVTPKPLFSIPKKKKKITLQRTFRLIFSPSPSRNSPPKFPNPFKTLRFLFSLAPGGFWGRILIFKVFLNIFFSSFFTTLSFRTSRLLNHPEP